MNGFSWRLPLFLVACLAQLWVPASMIVRAERTLAEGELFRFRTAPVDPADLVRGRYVALGFQETRGAPLDAQPFAPGQTVHALLERDVEGFARIAGVAHEAPEVDAYLTVEVERVDEDAIQVRFPIDRFYLPEQKAPEAERLYAKEAGRAAWAAIRVRAGQAVIEDLVIGGTSVLERTEPP